MTPGKKLLLAPCASLLVLACAKEPPRTPPQLTSAEIVSMGDQTKAESLLHEGDTVRALATAQEALAASPRDPRAHYDVAVAFEVVGAVDDAVDEYAVAAREYAGRSERGREVSLFGLAHLLASAGRCEGRARYEDYARLVEARSPRDAAIARQQGAECVTPPPASR